MADFIPNTSYQSNVMILAGSNTSDVVDFGGQALIGLIIPPAFTSTSLTFKMSDNNTTFYDLYNKDGNQLKITVAPNRAILFTPGDFIGCRWLQFIGSATESANRAIILILRNLI